VIRLELKFEFFILNIANLNWPESRRSGLRLLTRVS
jgi:hypothetical protein